MKKRLRVKAGPEYAGPQSSTTDPFTPPSGAVPDERIPQVHAPKPDAMDKVPSGEPPVQTSEIKNDRPVEEVKNHDESLLSPLKYVIDAPDAIEKMEGLLEKVAQARPDLADSVAQVSEIVDQLERKALGLGYEEHEAAEGETPQAQPPQPAGGQVADTAKPAEGQSQFKPGDQVTVTMKEGTYHGTVINIAQNGTYTVATDQNMTIDNIPATSLAQGGGNTMTLPASLKSKRISAAKARLKTKLEAKKAVKAGRGGATSLKPTGIKVVEEGGKVAVYDPAKNKPEQAQQVFTDTEGKLAAVDAQGNKTYEAQANDEVELSFWNEIRNLLKTAKPVAAGRIKAEDGTAAPRKLAEARKAAKDAASAAHVAEVELSQGHRKQAERDAAVAKGNAAEAHDAAHEAEQGLAAAQEANKKVGDVVEFMDATSGEDIQAEGKIVKIVGDTMAGDAVYEVAVKGKGYNVKIGADQILASVGHARRPSNLKMMNECAGCGETTTNATWLKGDPLHKTQDGGEPNAEHPYCEACVEKIKNLPVEASAFDKIDKIDLGDGYTARRKAAKGKKKADKEEGKDEPKVEAAQAVKAGDDAGDRFVNRYRCPDCQVEWEDQSPATNEDECPKCGKPYTPWQSEEIVEASQAVKAEEMPLLPGLTPEPSPLDATPPAEGEAPVEDIDPNAEIEVLDEDGKVVATYPDAFGDDTVMIIKFLREVLEIGKKKASKKDDKDSDKEDKTEKKEKKEKKEDDEDGKTKDKPKALPFVEKKEDKDEDKPKKDDDTEKLAAAQKGFEERVTRVRALAERLFRLGHIQASQLEVEANLFKGMTLMEAQRAASAKAVDQRVMNLLAQPEDELQILHASLPLLKEKQVTVQASTDGLHPINLSVLGTIEGAGTATTQVSIGDAFGRGFRR